jgi:hypothetical protein
LRDDFNTYESQVKAYRTAMDRWQDKFGQWKEKRGKAIASAEALRTNLVCMQPVRQIFKLRKFSSASPKASGSEGIFALLNHHQ